MAENIYFWINIAYEKEELNDMNIFQSHVVFHIMLLLTNCEVHKEKYLERSFEVRTERSEVRTKN